MAILCDCCGQEKDTGRYAVAMFRSDSREKVDKNDNATFEGKTFKERSFDLCNDCVKHIDNRLVNDGAAIKGAGKIFQYQYSIKSNKNWPAIIGMAILLLVVIAQATLIVLKVR